MRSLQSSCPSSRRAPRPPRRSVLPTIPRCRNRGFRARAPPHPRSRAPGTAWTRGAPPPPPGGSRSGIPGARNRGVPAPRRSVAATAPARRGSPRTIGSLRAASPAVGCLRLDRLGPSVLFLDALVDLLAVNLHARRRVDPELHVIPLHLHDRDLHVVSDPDIFAKLSGQEEHRALDDLRHPAGGAFSA